MKMTPGAGTITDYGSYINNCQANQMPFKIPVNSLADVQLYIDIGVTAPGAAQYDLIHTCGPAAGTVDSITPASYVVGQDTNGMWYGVFKNFSGSSATCFVIAITLDQIYFSEEYCLTNNCATDLVNIQGCYGNLANEISYDAEGIYFGIAQGAAVGDTTVVYKHEALVKNAEVSLAAIKNSFKQGRTRNFRTEKEKIYQFWSDRVPEWYLSEIDAVFYRGEVYIGATKYLLNSTDYELIDECKKQWMPKATFKKTHFQSFSCEADPCGPPVAECCDPEVISVTVEEVPWESGMEESGLPPGESGEESGGGGGIPEPSEVVVVIQAVVDGVPSVTGTFEPVTGIVNGSTVVTCDAFINVRVFVERGGFTNPGIDNGDGNYHTKLFTDNFITFSQPLVSGEFIYIQTIP